MLKLLGKLSATIMIHFFPIVVIAGLTSLGLMIFSVPKNEAGIIGLVIAIAIMSRYV